MRILFVIDKMKNYAGIERILTSKMNYIARNTTNEVYLTTYEQQDHHFPFPFDSSITHMPFEVIIPQRSEMTLPQWMKAYYVARHRFLQQFKSLIKDITPDIVVSTVYSYQVLDIIINTCHKKGIKTIMESHTQGETITLSSSKRNELVTGRNSLREDIRSDFSEKGRNKPSFCMQGSFAMKTTINPIGDKEYDVDDGVYIQGYSDKDMSEWPSTTTVHTWVKDAVQGYTSTNPIDKNTCVRVVFADNYHVDLPIYISKNEDIYLVFR